MPDVIIDGAIPRSDEDRGRALLTYLGINAVETIVEEHGEKLDIAIACDEYEEWENDVLQSIAESVGIYLDDDKFHPGKVMVGAHCPGDVVVFWPGDEDMPKEEDD